MQQHTTGEGEEDRVHCVEAGGVCVCAWPQCHRLHEHQATTGGDEQKGGRRGRGGCLVGGEGEVGAHTVPIDEVQLGSMLKENVA